MLLIAICVFAFNSLSAQTMKEVAVIDVDPAKLVDKHDDYYTEFYTSKKRRICKYYCIDLNDVLKPYTKDLSAADLRNLIVVAETSTGETMTTSFADFNDKIVRIAPMIIYSDIRSGIGDTVEFWDKEGTKGIVNLDGLDDELRKTRLRRIYLQIKKISKADKKRAFQERSIVFPQDQSTDRWIADVKYLKLYVVGKK